MEEENKKFQCKKCGRTFKSKKGLLIHESRVHPYIPPEPPKTTVELMPGNNIFNCRKEKLEKGAKTVKIGDSININTKYVVRKTIITEGDNTLEVEVEKVSGTWSKN